MPNFVAQHHNNANMNSNNQQQHHLNNSFSSSSKPNFSAQHHNHNNANMNSNNQQRVSSNISSSELNSQQPNQYDQTNHQQQHFPQPILQPRRSIDFTSILPLAKSKRNSIDLDTSKLFNGYNNHRDINIDSRRNSIGKLN
jgi:hypothetical protein